jgi:hypothetical protein
MRSLVDCVGRPRTVTAISTAVWSLDIEVLLLVLHTGKTLPVLRSRTSRRRNNSNCSGLQQSATTHATRGAMRDVSLALLVGLAGAGALLEGSEVQ